MAGFEVIIEGKTTKEGFGQRSLREKGLKRENRELKEKLAELYWRSSLKKLGDWLRRHKSGSTSAIMTCFSLIR
jgi:hypothetical protein